jgi:hypothetical protein
VLHALEKDPSHRPANAEEFHRELFGIAERLGLEHSGLLSAPSLETLRNAGTESPSGRLVVDLERLRENRASATAASEATLLSGGLRTAASARMVETESTAASVTAGTQKSHDFPRVTVPMNEQSSRSSGARKRPIVLGAVLMLLLGLGLAIVASRWGWISSGVNNTNAAAATTPTPPASPSPAASPKSTPEKAARNQPKNEPTPKKEKQSKIGAAFGKVKKLLKKPF